MKKLFLIIPLLIGCKSTKKTCDAYSIYYVPYKDSITVSQWHEHVEFDNKKYCIYVPKETFYVKDSIELKIPITNQIYKLK